MDNIIEGITTDIAKQVVNNIIARNKHWPIDNNKFVSTLSSFPEELLNDLEELSFKGYSIDYISRLFDYPTSIMYLWTLFFAENKLDKEKRLKLSNYLIKIYARIKKGPILNKNNHIVWNKEELNKKLKQAKFIKLKNRKITSQLYGLLFNYTELLHFHYHARSHEIHGPYKDQYLVREYFNFNLPFIHKKYHLPFKKILILSKVDDSKINIDLFQHIEYDNLHETKIAVKIDDRWITNLKCLKKINKQILDITIQLIREYKHYSEEDFFKRAVESLYYSIKPIKDLLGKEWYPEDQIINLKIIQPEFPKIEKDQIFDFIKSKFDPR